MNSSVMGLHKIIGCEENARAADIIFIHGLDGDAISTWQANNDSANFWPRWLGEELPNIGVWSLGYAVSSTAWKGNSMPLADRAINVLDQLELEDIGARPIVFICHSLGGLLAKQMLRHAYDSGAQDYQRIAKQTKAIVFLSTPHSGSNIANWVQHIGGLLRTSVSIEELEAHNPRLRELNTWFRNHKQLSEIKIQVYCEKIAIKGLLVVDESSADPGIKGVIPVPMDEDHITICKLKDKNSQIYKRVKKIIELLTVARITTTTTGQSVIVDAITPPSAHTKLDHIRFSSNMNGKEEFKNRIFISYSHDSPDHRSKVLGLSQRLRKDGLEAEIDQYINGTPANGWPRWMLDKLDEADYVLIICTETYYRRFRGHEVADKGKGVDWEGALITQELYNARSKTCKFVPVIFDANQQNFIPEPLRGDTFYILNSKQAYQKLYDFLLGQDGVEPIELGPITPKPRFTAEPLTFPDGDSDSVPTETNDAITVKRTVIAEMTAKLTSTITSKISEILLSNSELLSELKKIAKLGIDTDARSVATYLVKLDAVSKAVIELAKVNQAAKRRLSSSSEKWEFYLDCVEQLCGWLLLNSVDPEWWWSHQQQLKLSNQQEVSRSLPIDHNAYVEVVIAHNLVQQAKFSVDLQGELVPSGELYDPLLFDAISPGASEIQLLSGIYKDLRQSDQAPQDIDDLVKKISRTAQAKVMIRENKQIYYVVSKSYLDAIQAMSCYTELQRQLAGYMQFICCSPGTNTSSVCKENQLLLLDIVAEIYRLRKSKGSTYD